MFTASTRTTPELPRARHLRRAARLAGFAGLVLAAGACATDRDSRTAATAGSDLFQVVEGSTTTGPTTTLPLAPPSGGGGGGGGGGTPPPPPPPPIDTTTTTAPPVVEPPVMPTCEDVLATGQTLAVGPALVVLEPGDMVGALTITNCTDDAVDWTGETNTPSVTLAAPAGTVEGGASEELSFTVDEASIEVGPFDFTIKIGEPDHATYVDGQARRITNVDPGPGDLAPAPGTVTCADGCITSASVEQGAGTPDVAVAVSTDIPTTLDVYLLEQAPLLVGEDEPVIFGLDPTVTSASALDHLVPLAGLSPDTDYWAVIAARDEFGGEQVEWTMFHTTATGPGGLAGNDTAGCSVNCVTAALLSPDGAYTDLHVESHTAAHFWFFAAEAPFPNGDDGQPVLPDLSAAQASNGGDLESTTWDTTLTDLPFDTDLHVAIVAQDIEGKRSVYTGEYHTHPAPMVEATFETITVLQSGDDDNVGELEFGWGFDGTEVGSRPIDGVAEGTTLTLGGTTSFTFQHAPVWPWLRVVGSEQDASDDGIYEDPGPIMLRPLGPDVATAQTTNEASSGILLGATVEGMADCADYGVDAGPDARCLLLEGGGDGDAPVFRAVVSVTYV